MEDIVALARGIAEEEGIALPNVDSHDERPTLRNLGAFARGYEALVLRNKQGKEWHQIAEELGFKSASVAYKAALAARKKLDFESRDDIRFRQRERLSELYDALQPAIKRRDKNTPRAIEVAVKLLEREARLEGIDLEGAAQEQGSRQIAIIVQPHPGDQKARDFVEAEREDRKLLPPSIIDVSEYEEIHLPDRGDG